MKERLVALTLSLATVIAGSLPPTAQAQGVKQFYCDLTGATPTTKVIEDGSTRNLIRWTNNYWSDKGYSPARRCQIVSNAISNVYQSEGSFLLNVGTMNRTPVICVTEREPGYGGVYPCRIQILTLAPGENGQAVLQQFRENLTQAGGGLGIERDEQRGPFIIE